MSITDIFKNSGMMPPQPEDRRVRYEYKPIPLRGEDLNARFNLPFEGVRGSKHEMKDCIIIEIDYDQYELGVKDNFSISPGNIAQMIVIDAATVKAIIDGAHRPDLGLYRPTEEDRKELQNLKDEFSRWKKNKKLESFKSLPAHLRQEIVDEAILRDLMTSNRNEPLNQEFDGWKRMTELEEKFGPNYLRPRAFIRPESDYMTHEYKYIQIIENFTLQELTNAHAEASLEDELKD